MCKSITRVTKSFMERLLKPGKWALDMFQNSCFTFLFPVSGVTWAWFRVFCSLSFCFVLFLVLTKPLNTGLNDTQIQKLSPSFLFSCFWCYVTLTVLIHLPFNVLLLVLTWSSSIFMFYSFFNQYSLICVFHLQRSFLISHLHHLNQWYGHVYQVHLVLIIFFGILVLFFLRSHLLTSSISSVIHYQSHAFI